MPAFPIEWIQLNKTKRTKLLNMYTYCSRVHFLDVTYYFVRNVSLRNLNILFAYCSYQNNAS